MFDRCWPFQRTATRARAVARATPARPGARAIAPTRAPRRAMPKRASDDALEDDRCAACEHYHARGTTCSECGHVRALASDASAPSDAVDRGARGAGRARPQSTTVVEVIERFLLVGAFEHTSSERALLAAGVRTVINAVPSCTPCCSGKYLSVVTLNAREPPERGLDLRHACERLQALHARSARADESYPMRVLVYCMSGRSKAPSVAVAYVMFKMRMGLREAKAFVEGRYPGGHRGMRLKPEDEEALEAFERELAENPPDAMPIDAM